MNPNDMFTKNSFVDKVLGWLPNEPLTQSKFIYYLTIVVFTGLFGYATMAWIHFFQTYQFSYLFQGLFMLAISGLSLFGLKQTRSSYMLMKKFYKNPVAAPQVESVSEMIEGFDKEK